MISKDLILNKIRELTQENGGKPFSIKAFAKASGISSNQICGKYWTKWSEAVTEAGCTPNRFPEKVNIDLICQKMAELIKELGRFPTPDEIKYKAFNDKSFPAASSYTTAFGWKFTAAKKILDYCTAHEGFNETAEICDKIYQEGIAEDEQYAKYYEKTHCFLALEKRGKNRYFVIARQKPFMVNQLKLQGINILHQIAAESREYALELIKEKYKSCYNRIGNWYSFSAAELNELKKCYYIKGILLDK